MEKRRTVAKNISGDDYVTYLAIEKDAANAQWDKENRFDLILPDYLKHM